MVDFEAVTTPPPTLSVGGLRVFFVGLAAALGIWCAVAGGVVAWVAVAALTAWAIRAMQVNIQFDNDVVVVRNFCSTDRIALSDIARFGLGHPFGIGTPSGPSLVVYRTDGTRKPVTAYPMTAIPSIARRREQVVTSLNTWLRNRAG